VLGPPPRDRLSTLGLVAATFFIVSGGPYGLEEIVLGHGYAGAIGLLVLVPLVWSLPVALMVGELGAALPETGGYYVWVERAMGRFWGLQEAWLSLAVGVVNVAIYPTLLVTYVGRLWPSLGSLAPGRAGWWLSMAVIAACTAANAAGIRSVGRSSMLLGAALLAPFAAMVALALARLPQGGLSAAGAALRQATPADGGALAAGLILAMWNLMGFDNASTFAAEVRDPGRSYPRAMAISAALIAGVYVVAVLAASVTGMPPAAWSSGAWVEVGARIGGERLAFAVTLGGAVSALGLYMAQLLSWSRLPVALAEDRWLPARLGRRSARTHAPVPAVVLGGALSALCIGVGLRQLIGINVFLYGASLVLELVALVVLRVREPDLARPYRIPGGLGGALLVAVLPTALLAMAAWQGRDEPGALGMSALGLSAAMAAIGPIWWAGERVLRRRGEVVSSGDTT
jgi:amino acid transporter